MSEGGWGEEDRGQRTEDGGQRTEPSGARQPKGRGLARRVAAAGAGNAEDGGRKTEGGGRRTEGGGRRTEGGGRGGGRIAECGLQMVFPHARARGLAGVLALIPFMRSGVGGVRQFGAWTCRGRLSALLELVGAPCHLALVSRMPPLFPNRSIAAWILGLALGGLVAGCGKPSVASRSEGSIGNTPAWFEDATEGSGLDFTHEPGPVGTYFFPQIMGSGAALFDYDGDGRLDIYLIQNGGPDSPSTNRLFHQETDGTFRDTSDGSGLDVAGFGMGAACGDVNNDGRVDLLLTEYGRMRTFPQ